MGGVFPGIGNLQESGSDAPGLAAHAARPANPGARALRDRCARCSRPQRRRSRCVRLAGVAVSLALLEAGSALALGLLRQATYASFPEIKQRFVVDPLDAHLLGSRPLDPKPENDRPTRLRLHPYFGFVRAPGPGIDDMGFLAEQDLPYRAAPDELVVGVFGGSVAEHLCAQERRRLSEGIAPIVAERGYAKVTVLCLAVVGFRFPQTEFAFLEYLDTIDVAVFLEGFNEIVFWSEAGYPPEFPNIGLWKPLVTQAASHDEARLAELEHSLSRRRRWTAPFQRLPGIDRSAFAHLVWAVGAELERAREAAAQRRLEASAETSLRFGARGEASDRELRARYLDRLGAFLDLSTRIGRWRDVPVVHALQPNQYVDGSKPFSAEEASIARRNPDLHAFVAAGYPRLRGMFAQARRKGATTFDLTQVFASLSETVWADDCCHLNERGTRLLADALLSSISAEREVFDRIPAARVRPSDSRREASARWRTGLE